MSITNATVLIADISQEVRRANDLGATHLQLPTLDVAWLLEMATRSTEQRSHDHDNLQLLHELVAQLCIKLGATPADVPCDVWHLSLQVEQLQRNMRALAEAWSLVDQGARSGIAAECLRAADVACDRALHHQVTP